MTPIGRKLLASHAGRDARCPRPAIPARQRSLAASATRCGVQRLDIGGREQQRERIRLRGPGDDVAPAWCTQPDRDLAPKRCRARLSANAPSAHQQPVPICRRSRRCQCRNAAQRSTGLCSDPLLAVGITDAPVAYAFAVRPLDALAAARSTQSEAGVGLPQDASCELGEITSCTPAWTSDRCQIGVARPVGPATTAVLASTATKGREGNRCRKPSSRRMSRFTNRAGRPKGTAGQHRVRPGAVPFRRDVEAGLASVLRDQAAVDSGPSPSTAALAEHRRAIHAAKVHQTPSAARAANHQGPSPTACRLTSCPEIAGPGHFPATNRTTPADALANDSDRRGFRPAPLRKSEAAHVLDRGAAAILNVGVLAPDDQESTPPSTPR